MSAISRPHVSPLVMATVALSNYEWALGSVGYESRARHFYETHPVKSIHREVFLFSKQQVIAFDENRRVLREKGFTEVEMHDETDLDSQMVNDLVARIENHARQQDAEDMRIIADISSMTRQMIALLCIGLSEAAARLTIPIYCDFVYCLAKFGELPELNGPIVSNGPVVSKLAGWCRTPGVSCGLIVGIGYEEDLALGVIEELEAGAVWAFRPRNEDPRYDAAIDEHNQGLFETISRNRLVRYWPRDPYALFIALDQLAALTKLDYRLIITPFGPKIFALAGCLVGLANFPDVGVWRVSAGPNLKPVDREVAGSPVGLRVSFGV